MVKGSTRVLLETLQSLILEGQTVTAPITDTEIAILTGYHEKTVGSARKKLQQIGLLRVLDGGQGSVARYELLAGAAAALRSPPCLKGVTLGNAAELDEGEEQLVAVFRRATAENKRLILAFLMFVSTQIDN